MLQPKIRVMLLLLADLLSYSLSWCLGLGFVCNFGSLQSHKPGQLYGIGLVFYLIGNIIMSLYRDIGVNPNGDLGPVAELRSQFKAAAVSLLLLLLADNYIPESWNWLQLDLATLVLLVNLSFLPFWRLLFRTGMRRWQLGMIPVLIVGKKQEAEALAQKLQHDRHFGFYPGGMLIDDLENKAGTGVWGTPVLGAWTELPTCQARTGIQYLLLCQDLPVLDLKPFRKVLRLKSLYPLTLSFSGKTATQYLSKSKGCSRLPWNELGKLMIDKIVSTALLLLLAPLFLLLAILVKQSSPGPVFFQTTRLGKNGRPFQIYKFRTMVDNAEAQLSLILQKDGQQQSLWQKHAKLHRDPRVTKMGKFLRRSSLDELPQLWNVLKGDMSLIGPRPIAAWEIKHYGADYQILQSCKPGLTGLWQVSGRSNLPYPIRVQLDIYYIQHYSLTLDYYILFKTFKEIYSGQGAC